MTIDDIARLIRRLESSDVTELEVADETSSLTLRLSPNRGQASVIETQSMTAEADVSQPEMLCATAIGRFRLHHPEAARNPEATERRTVAAGDILGFLEAGGCLRPVVAGRDSIATPLVEDGSLVGYGTPLFRLV